MRLKRGDRRADLLRHQQFLDDWVRVIAERYERPIADFDYFATDPEAFVQEIASAIRHLAIEQAKALLYPSKEKATQTQMKVRKLQRSDSIIDRLAAWYYTKMKLQSIT